MIITEKNNEESKKYYGLSIYLIVLSKQINIPSKHTDWKIEPHCRDLVLMYNIFCPFFEDYCIFTSHKTA